MNDYNDIYGGSAVIPSPLSADSAEEKAVAFEKKEQILSFLCMAAGFLFVRLCCYHTTGVLTTLLFCAVTTLCIIWLRRSGKAFKNSDKFLTCVLYAFSAVYTVTANQLLTFLCTLFLLLVLSLLLYSVCQPDSHTFGWMPFTLKKALLSHPFGSFHKCPAAALSTVRSKNDWKNLLYALAGLVLTVPLTVIVAALLSSADDGMERMISSLFFEPSYEALILIPHTAIGLLAGFYLFGMLYSNIRTPKPLSDDACKQCIQGMRIMPNAMVYAAATPICILYVMFFVSQLRYFLGGFTGEIAQGFTYAEYARQGFFELCTVCCINFAVIGIMSFMAKLCGENKPVMLKIYTLFLSICSLILAGTSLAKMFLYIHAYGMTQLRIYTSWFILLLVIGFILIVIRQFRAKLPVCKIAFLLFTAMFALLCFSRPDAWMTRYNAEMHLSGQLEEFDYKHLNSLSDDALSAVLAYRDVLEEAKLQDSLQQFERDCSNDFYHLLNLSSWQIMAYGGTAE